MKPRWTIRRVEFSHQGVTQAPCGCRWAWFRRDRNGHDRPIQCVGHGAWTGLVRRFEVKP